MNGTSCDNAYNDGPADDVVAAVGLEGDDGVGERFHHFTVAFLYVTQISNVSEIQQNGILQKQKKISFEK